MSSMIGFFLIYIGKVALCTGLFYVVFKLFLSGETFFGLNRRILIVGTLACFILPLVKFTLPETATVHSPFFIVQELLEKEVIAEVVDSKAVETSPTVQPAAETGITLANVLFAAFVLGAVINLIHLSKSVYSIKQFIGKGRKVKFDTYNLIVVKEDVSPFCWRKYVVVSEYDYSTDLEEILAHETAHIAHRHTYDILFFELLTLLQWFNPAIWLLKKELKDIHEYQADKSALHTGIDATKYQLLLVKKAVGSSSYTLANSLYHSKIKKRITMMLRKRSKKSGRLKLLMLLPAAALAMYAFAQPDVVNVISQMPPTAVTEEIRFSMPLKNSVKITAKFGIRKRNGKDYNHRGVDMRGKGRDTIYTIAPGTVILSERDSKKGNYIRIRHAGGIESEYAHNSSNMVKPGEKVNYNQPIGITGSTGRSTGDHLHLEIWKDGEPVDPMEMIKEL